MALTADFKYWLQKSFGHRVKFNEPMARHTSLRVGGPAGAFIMPAALSELKVLIHKARQRQIPYYIAGGGTNLLVKDGGMPGIVIYLARYFDAIRLTDQSPQGVTVSALAGARTQHLCRFALKNGFDGMNFALGIPGTIGGAIMMNAGTHLGSMQDVLFSVKLIMPNGEIQHLERKNLTFGYRQLKLKNGGLHRQRPAAVLKGSFSLKYSEKRRLNREAVGILKQRKRSQPTALPNAGCFFKNPKKGKSAGELIELAGLKGKKIGDAQISVKHGNFIVNTGRASAADILKLMEIAKETVSTMFNIDLQNEVIIVGK